MKNSSTEANKQRGKTTDYGQLLKRRGILGGSRDAYHDMLALIHPGCYVETVDGQEYGQVTKVIRDQWGVPVAVEVRGGGKECCINVEKIYFYEQAYPASMHFTKGNRFYVTIEKKYGEPSERVW